MKNIKVSVSPGLHKTSKRVMMPLSRGCHSCGKLIDIENEMYYTIGKEPTRHDKLNKKNRTRIYFFHQSCFEEVAGDLYL